MLNIIVKKIWVSPKENLSTPWTEYYRCCGLSVRRLY